MHSSSICINYTLWKLLHFQGSHCLFRVVKLCSVGYIALICTTVDLPVKAISNIVQFNGYWDCCHCLKKVIGYWLQKHLFCYIQIVKSQHVACGEKGTTQTYPFIEEDSCGPLRNHQQTCHDAEFAVKENQSVSGSNV